MTRLNRVRGGRAGQRWARLFGERGDDLASRSAAGPSGRVLGLLGGSFDPPHPGHLHVSLEAMKRFRLDRVWWLVSPGNPLKARGPAELGRRIAAARAVMRRSADPVTGIEAQLGTRHTAERRSRRSSRFIRGRGSSG